jgi:NADH-quinone oxidoreductase subunit L
MGIPLITIICILFLSVRGARKSAFVWLPDAMAGPTPVSFNPRGHHGDRRRCCPLLFPLSPMAMTVVAVVGVLTALFAATIGLFQYDIKGPRLFHRLQLGYMFVALVGAYWVGVYHLSPMLFLKRCLLGSGSVMFDAS